MLVTVTNTSGAILNLPATRANTRDFTGIAGYTATGGDLLRELPHPFGLTGEIAVAGNVQRSMHEQDFRRGQWFDVHDPAQQWDHMIQKGYVTFAIAAETDSQDAEDAFIGTI